MGAAGCPEKKASGEGAGADWAKRVTRDRIPAAVLARAARTGSTAPSAPPGIRDALTRSRLGARGRARPNPSRISPRSGAAAGTKRSRCAQTPHIVLDIGNVIVYVPPMPSKKRKAVTLHEIADRAGISHVAVSRVLSGRYRGEVSEKRAGEVRRLAKRLGYVPNHAARCLRAGRTRIVLGISDHVLGRWAPRRIRAFETALEKRGHSLLMQLLAGIDEAEKLNALEKCCSVADGLIVLGLAVSKPANVERFRRIVQNAPPSICPTASIAGTACNFARVNWNESFSLIGEHYRQLGHARVGICGLKVDEGHWRTFASEMAKSGVGAERFFVDKAFDERAYYQAGVVVAQRWLAMENRPNALYCTSDEMALSLMEIVRHRHVRVPEDLAVIGGGDSDFREWLQPPLTVLTHSEDELAELAVSDLVQRIEKGERVPGTGICVGVIKQQLIIGGSCGARS
jgi:DNA-binding LacI/PurR family transcriptional regulator